MNALMLAVLLAQSPPPAGGGFKVTLELYGYWGLITEADGRCPVAPAGTDTLSGIVRLSSADEDATIYTGTLTRTTNIGLCEVKDTADGEKWCGGELHGGGPVKVTIVVPPSEADNESLQIELQPQSAVTVAVGGNCSSLDNAAVAHQYKSHDAISFETSNDLSDRVPPTGMLVSRNDVYYQTRRVGSDRGYTLKVEPAP